MWGEKFTVYPFSSVNTVVCASGDIGVVTQMSDQAVASIKNRDAPSQIGNHEIFTLLLDLAGTSQHALDDSKELAVHVELLQPVVLAICHDQLRLFTTRINPDAMRRVELPGIASRASNRPHPLSVRIVLVNPVHAVSISDEETSVRSHRKTRRAKLRLVLVLP